MKKDELNRLKEYIFNTNYPLLINNIPSLLYEGAVILENDVDIALLNGHYEGVEYLPPNWLKVLYDNSKIGNSLLIINNINEIDIEEQMKFGEILKYRKISTFDIPDNCTIIVTVNNLDSMPINENIYSLLVHI